MQDCALQTKSQRKDWVDVLRALAILLVMYGHIGKPGNAYYVFTSPIKIPLFFAISGYVFNGRDGQIVPFLKRLLQRLVIPWLVLSLSQAVLIIPKGLASVCEFVLKVLTGREFWYMPCCILAEVFFFCVLKFCKKQWKIVAVALGLTLIGLLLPKTEWSEMLKFRTALVAQGYLLIGFAFRRYEEYIGKVGFGWLLGGLATYVLLGVFSMHFFPEQSLDVNVGSYYSYPLCAVMIVLGCFVMFSLFRRIERFPKALTLLGCNTLVFYLFHTNVIRVFGAIGILPTAGRWTGIVNTLISCAACAVIAIVLNYVLPEAVGKKRSGKLLKS